jgi:hypothetical protein
LTSNSANRPARRIARRVRGGRPDKRLEHRGRLTPRINCGRRLPFTIEVDAPAGTIPWLRGLNASDTTCRVLVDGQDVTLRHQAGAQRRV